MHITTFYFKGKCVCSLFNHLPSLQARLVLTLKRCKQSTLLFFFLFSVLHLCRILMIYNVKSHNSPLGLKPFVDSRRANVYPVTNILLQSLLANT